MDAATRAPAVPTGAGGRPRLCHPLSRTLPRPSPWLGTLLPVGTGTRTNMAAPSQPRQATYDAIVIGAGIQGSFTAYHLAQRHRNTLLLEQVLVSPAPPRPQPCWVPVPSPDALGRAPADLCALCHSTERSRCWHPCSLVPAPPCPQCQDPPDPSARILVCLVPGPP